MKSVHRSARYLRAVLAVMLIPMMSITHLWVTPAAAFSQVPAPVFINEIHYDNTGTDTGEAIEIAGPAGTDLSGWSIILYNGNGGAVYDTDALSGVIPNQQNGFGTVVLSYASNGIQNGSPDGIALVNGSTVIQFLSYEGVFAAVGGPANGLTSTSIGVSENGTEVVGLSLQLSGTGSNYADFSWNVPSTPTFGAINTGQTFIAQSDLPPTVSAVVPANGSSDVASTSTVVVSFTEPVTVAANAFSLSCNNTAQTLNVTGGPTSYTLTPAAALPDGASCTLTVTASAVTDQDGTADPMAADVTSGFSVATPVVCGTPDTPIGQIQGEGTTVTTTSPVTIQGVIVGDYEGPAPALRGFYLQDAGDGNPLTSDAIFVFNGNNNSVSLGQVVQVTGTPAEFQDQTQLAGTLTIESCGSESSVIPVDVTLPFPAAVNSVPFEERYEGMLVRMAQKLYVTEHFQLGRFGQVVLSANSRLAQPTNVELPGAAANALQAANNQNRIIVDDALQNQNPDPIVFGRNGQPLSASNTLRGGDSVENLVGVLTYTWAGNSASPNAYRIRPLQALGGGAPNFVGENARPAAAPEVGGRLKVVGMNVLNYFLTLDIGTTPACGPIGNKQECRGAESALELSRQQQKLNQALVKLDADIIAMMELENTQDANGNDVNPLADIVARLNNSVGAGTYDYINTGIIGTDTIRVGMIYKTSKVRPLGSFQILDSTDDPRFIATRNRPSLAQTFEEVGLDTRFTVVANHLKSKGCGTDATGLDLDQGDGQGCWNVVRRDAAAALVDWIASDPTGSGDPDFLILGDLNSYAMEDPIRTILNGSDDTSATTDDFVNLILRFGGMEAYSYVFDGQWGYLDHALASSSLNGQVTGSADYHINSDEPSVLDYNTNFKTPGLVSSLFAPDEYRISDHDPVMIGLDLADTTPPTASASVTGSVRPGCAADCYDGKATVTLNMSEPGTITYSLNNGEAQQYTGPFDVTTEGVNTIQYYATDLAGNVSATQSVSFKVTHYPVLPVVDNFNRRNAGLGRDWGVLYTDSYRISSNQGLVGTGGPAYYRGTSNAGPIFGVNQAVALTLVNPVGVDQGILLKIQPQGSGAIGTYKYQNGAIDVWYNSSTGLVTISVFEKNIGWRDLGAFAATIQPGSVLGAVALDNGTIKAYVNCELIGSVKTPLLANKGGLTGIWYENSSGARFDNFQAGTLVP